MNTNAHASYQNHIGDAPAAAADGLTFTAINPTTGAPWCTFADSGKADVDRAVQAATDALQCPGASCRPPAAAAC